MNNQLAAHFRSAYFAFLGAAALSLLLGLRLQAQENDSPAQVIARNNWEAIYYRISATSSAPNLLDMLQTMAEEVDQAALASSYALMLKDQIHSYITNRAAEPVYTQQILSFLLDKVAELTPSLANENAEIISTIGLNLLPELDYNMVMGKANYALGCLGASNFGKDILKHLEKINYIMGAAGNDIVGSRDLLGLSYAALDSMDALMQLKVPGTFSVLFQINYGPFPQNVRNRAAQFIKNLQQQNALAIEEEFIQFTVGASTLTELELISQNLGNAELMFNTETYNKINLALLKRINESIWPSSLISQNVKATILLKSMKDLLASGAKGLQEEVSEQLIQSIFNANSANIKLLALEMLGTLATPNSIAFLQQEIRHINAMQHSAAINYAEERTLRQLVYALGISGDSSPETRLALQEVAITPYPAIIRRFAEKTLAKIS